MSTQQREDHPPRADMHPVCVTCGQAMIARFEVARYVAEISSCCVCGGPSDTGMQIRGDAAHFPCCPVRPS